MQKFLTYILMFFCASLELSTVMGEEEDAFPLYRNVRPRENIFDVTRFGAVGDGRTNDSKAFELAWAAACHKVANTAKIRVPVRKRFLLSPMQFGGPCKCHSITFEILGSIIAQPKLRWEIKTKGQWLKFSGINGLAVVGNGQGLIDGQGDSWWRNFDNARPAAMAFSSCNNLEISGLKHINSPKFHVSISNCNNVNISRLHIIAPSQSPNTDGIDLFSSRNINIQNCIMETGDDCIAIKGGTSNITISDIACGPGHGISIGSLGKSGKYDQVDTVDIRNCSLIRTQNGIRIKTWQGGSGFVRNINFSNIHFIMADNPVVIDQFYCPHMTCTNKTSAIKVSDVRYKGLYGTSNGSINFRCSNTAPCTNIMVEGLDIRSGDPHRPPVPAVCINAHGTAHNITNPPLNCLKKQ